MVLLLVLMMMVVSLVVLWLVLFVRLLFGSLCPPKKVTKFP